MSNKQYIKFELKGSGLTTADFDVLAFFQSIYKPEYSWRILEINYVGKEGFDISTLQAGRKIEEKVNNARPDGLLVSWDELLLILQSTFQFLDFIVKTYKAQEEIIMFEIFDCASIEITTSDTNVIEKFHYWIDNETKK